MALYLSDNFTFDELTTTSSGKHQVENKREAEKPEHLVALTRLCCEVLQPLRLAYGKPLTVNSGFRSLSLNTSIGGSKTSQHLLGQAADITTGCPTANKALWNLARELARSKQIKIGQLILEIPNNKSWIHISTPTVSISGQVLIYDGKKYTTIETIK